MTASYPKESLPNGYTSSATYTNGHTVPSMDSRQGEYPQSSGLGPPDQHVNKASDSEASSSNPDHAPPAQYTPQQDVKFNPSAAATPTNSDYSLNPSSARSGTFPEYIHRGGYPDASQQQQRYHPTSAPNGATPNNMAQPSSPSMPLVDGQPSDHPDSARNANSNNEVPVDPSIAASSPTYPPTHHYSPYPPQHEMPPQYHTPPMYPRPEYGGPYSAPPHGLPGTYGHVTTSVSTPPSVASAGARPLGVSFGLRASLIRR